MAVIHIDKQFSFPGTPAWDWTHTVANSTTVTLSSTSSSNAHELTLTGAFDYEEEEISGIVEGATYSRDGNLVYTITDIGRSAALLQDALDLVEAHDEPEILLAYLFGGDDEMYGSAGRQVIYGYDGDDYIHGGGGDDVLLSGVGNDTVEGGNGHDTVRGGYGDDSVDGGTGTNTLYSGGGNDTFVIKSNGAGIDTIADFNQGTDLIELGSGTGLAFNNLADSDGALDPDLFVANSTGTAVDADDRIVYNTVTGQLYYDKDGSGAQAAVQFALVGTSFHAALTAADFTVDVA